MVSQMIFHVMVSIGLLIPSGDVDGRVIYDVYTQDCELVAEYAYKGEVLNYINTGAFSYDEMYEDCCPLIDK